MPKKGLLPGITPQKNLSRFFVIFSLVALLSALGLDYIAWQKGEKSYVFDVFDLFARRDISPSEKSPLQHTVREKLFQYGITPRSLDHYQDSHGFFHLLVDLPLKKYQQLESPLEQDLVDVKASVVKKEEQQTEDRNYYLWEIGAKEKQKVILLFSCVKEKARPEKALYPEEEKNKAAIIIDDMGYSLRAIRELISIKKPLTVAVLPFSPLAKETAYLARQNGLEVILHLPLESINSQDENNQTEGIIHSQMSQQEIIQTVEKNLAQVPHVVGVNNHMGSKITANQVFMRIILEHLQKKNLFFIDSRTTNHTVAYKTARALGVPSAYRKVFLDTENGEHYIQKKLIELFTQAKREGWALGICHPIPETLKVLRENLHLADDYDLQLVFASQIVK
ncbi:MAG: divergent polysaccharide deacetylase family protein [Candidatus Aminicenantes bacterium]